MELNQKVLKNHKRKPRWPKKKLKKPIIEWSMNRTVKKLKAIKSSLSKLETSKNSSYYNKPKLGYY